MGAAAPRRLLPVLLIALLLILTTSYYIASLKDVVQSPREIVATVSDKLKGVVGSPPSDVDGNPEQDEDTLSAPSETSSTEPEPAPQTSSSLPSLPSDVYDHVKIAEAEKGAGGKGQHYHIRPSTPPSPSLSIPNCEYPILIHTSADKHCTGALALYASIVRNTLTQPEALRNKTCVHFTYVDPTMTTIEEMYSWEPKPNPFTAVEDCAKLDTIPEFNDLVPVRWQALTLIEKPSIMKAGDAHWVPALNKVHSWAFDLYPRILLLDADSFILTDLADIFLEIPRDVTVAGPPDQFWDCHDRTRINGGMILLGQPGRYFHMVMAELLQDDSASCMTGKWEQSEQELLNCLCGWNYNGLVLHQPRPEFSCRMMPIYNSVWPRNYGCSDVNVRPMRSIHFTSTSSKPWSLPEDTMDERFDTAFYKCLRDSARNHDVEGLRGCVIPPLEETRLIKNYDVKTSAISPPIVEATPAPAR